MLDMSKIPHNFGILKKQCDIANTDSGLVKVQLQGLQCCLKSCVKPLIDCAAKSRVDPPVSDCFVCWRIGVILSSSSDMLQGRWNLGLTLITPSDFIPWNTWQAVDLTESRIVWTAASQPITTKASYFFARFNSFLRRFEVHKQRTNWKSYRILLPILSHFGLNLSWSRDQ